MGEAIGFCAPACDPAGGLDCSYGPPGNGDCSIALGTGVNHCDGDVAELLLTMTGSGTTQEITIGSLRELAGLTSFDSLSVQLNARSAPTFDSLRLRDATGLLSAPYPLTTVPYSTQLESQPCDPTARENQCDTALACAASGASGTCVDGATARAAACAAAPPLSLNQATPLPGLWVYGRSLFDGSCRYAGVGQRFAEQLYYPSADPLAYGITVSAAPSALPLSRPPTVGPAAGCAVASPGPGGHWAFLLLGALLLARRRTP